MSSFGLFCYNKYNFKKFAFNFYRFLNQSLFKFGTTKGLLYMCDCKFDEEILVIKRKTNAIHLPINTIM